MTEKRKYRLILAAKIALVAVIAASHCFYVMYWFYFALFIIGEWAIVICLLLIIGLGELFPKSRKGKGFFIRHVAQPLILTGTAVVTILICTLGQEAVWKLGEAIKRNHIESFMERAEAVMEYNTATYYMGGIDGIDTEHSLIIIDYDTMEIGFLLDGIYNYEEFQLIKGEEITDYNIQATADLPFPAKKFTSFYTEENLKHRTIAMQITMEDGTVYVLDNMTEEKTGYEYFLGLSINEKIRPMGSEPPEENPFR